MNTQISTMGFFEVGDKTSLICADTETTQTIKDTLRDLGFKFQVAETPETAIERIRYTNYDCIVVHEHFGGCTLQTNAILNYMRPLPMLHRRECFTCVVGPSFKTLDAMQGFCQSVHMVINPADLPNLTAIMKKGLTEFELLYHSYRELQRSVRDGATAASG